LIPLKDILIR